MRTARAVWSLAVAFALLPWGLAQEFLVTDSAPGNSGGTLVVCQRAEPKTLNPVLALDAPSREVIRRMHADLITINRRTQKTEPGLAKSWKVSAGGRRYVLELRRGVRFSDGQPFTADDVVFTFQVYLDEKLHSVQRDLLIVGGQPITVEKLNDYAVAFGLKAPYAAAERIFDSIPMLPKHLLEMAWREGKLQEAWGLNATVSQIAGLGPFRLKQYVPGERVVLERNPWYWKRDKRGKPLPYFDAVEFRFIPTEDAQVLRFTGGDVDILDRVGAKNFLLLERDARSRGDQLQDLGPGLEYNFLFFNLGGDGGSADQARRQMWFRDVRFRQAVSAAVDRDGIVRLVYGGRATPLWGHVTPGNRLWVSEAIPKPPRSLDRSKELLKAAGFHWSGDGDLFDSRGNLVEFSLVVSASNSERVQMATIIQDDLKHLGIHVQVVPLEFRSLVDRVLDRHQYDACIFGLGGGDADPNSEMNVWLSSGATHVWNPSQKEPATAWEAEIDTLMRQQMTEIDYSRRKAVYDRVQQIVSRQLPIIPLVSPHVLAAARGRVGNFQPAVLDHHTLWNVEQLFFRRQ